MRIGNGYDVHRLVPGRKLILGGEEIPYPLGLDGHSDADVLVHAICDALLGAAALGDLGRHFPDTDPQYTGICSLELLRQVCALLHENGYEIENIDSILVAQRPKIAPYTEKMRSNLAQACAVDPSCIGVKATTEEGIGLTGGGEAMSSYAVALIRGRSEEK